MFDTVHRWAGGSGRAARQQVAAAGLLAAALLAFGIRDASGSETQWWVTADARDYAGAVGNGVVVRPNGTLELGPSATVSTSDSIEVIWTMARLGTGLALGADGGRVLRWTASRGIEPWVELPVGQVLSLVSDGDAVIAGTGPEGFIYRIQANGDTARVAETGESYVWRLVRAGPDAWYAATGTQGRVLEVTRRGNVSVVLDTDETNIVSLIDDGRGGAYAGGDSKGHVIHVRADGSARTLFDAPQNEIRALALDASGALFAAALSSKAVENASKPGENARPSRRSGSRDQSVVYRIRPDSLVVEWWQPPHPLVFDMITTADGVIAATGNDAALYLIGDAQEATQWLSVSQEQFTALTPGANGDLFAATSNPAAVWRVRPSGRAGTLESPVFDAKRTSRLGNLRWSGQAGGGRVEFQTRSGNTEAPDTTWSAWSSGRATADGMRSTSPAARYAQWRLSLSGGQPRVESVEWAWREHNVPPIVGNVRVAPQGVAVKDGRMNPRSEPVTQELSGGRRVEFSLKRKETPQERRDLPMWVRGIRIIQWNAEDANEDPLLFRIDVRSEGDGAWLPVAADLEDSTFAWDTAALPDGRYRVRVTASDRVGNAVGEERSATSLGPPFTVDNTEPEIDAFDASAAVLAIRVRGRASDTASAIWRVEVAVDDKDWRPVTPAGGLADDRTVSFDATLSGVTAGIHAVSVRVVDRAGNFSVRSTRVTVPAAR